MMALFFIALVFVALIFAAVGPIVIMLKLNDIETRLHDVEHGLTRMLIGDFGPEGDDPERSDEPTIPQRIRAVAASEPQVAA